MGTDPTPATSWWPLTRKIRTVVAAGLTTSAALLAGALTGSLPGGWAAALAGIIVAAGLAASGYLTSDE